jgi:hypothetical protein
MNTEIWLDFGTNGTHEWELVDLRRITRISHHEHWGWSVAVACTPQPDGSGAVRFCNVDGQIDQIMQYRNKQWVGVKK